VPEADGGHHNADNLELLCKHIFGGSGAWILIVWCSIQGAAFALYNDRKLFLEVCEVRLITIIERNPKFWLMMDE